MIFQTLKRTYQILFPAERRLAVVTLLLSLVTAVVEVAGVASILPFLSVATAPESVETSPQLLRLYQFLGFASTGNFLIFLGGLSFFIIVGGAVFRTFAIYVTNRFTHTCRYSLSSRLLETYLLQPYAFFLGRNSADMAKEIFNEVSLVVGQVISPGISIFAKGMTAGLLIIMLLLVDPVMTVSSVLVLTFFYWGIYRLVRQRSARTGKERSKASQARYEAADAALGGAKTVKVMGLEKVFLSRFQRAACIEEKHLAENATISQIPRFAIEALALGGVILIILSMLMWHEGRNDAQLEMVLPQLGLFALAGYKMLPGLQGIYQAVTTIRFAGNGLERLFSDMALSDQTAALPTAAARPLPLHAGLEFRDVTYRYPGGGTAGLNDVTLSIPRGIRVGIVGTTGAGKTTLIDVMLGLLEPDQGEVKVDGIRLTPETRSAWQANIGYVPQDIYLLDASIAENIAIGVPDHEIDIDRVNDALRMACLLEFVETDLPQGVTTGVGQRGVRISGGQRQRIGIARALYRNPDLIIFDEATSALDTVTEQDVMQAIHGLEGQKTIVMIAHRLSTIRDCDIVVVMEDGRVLATGTFDDLSAQGIIHDVK